MLSSLSELFTKNIDNAVDLFDETDLATIAKKAQDQYDQDLVTISHKIEQLKEIMALAMIVSEQKSYPWPNASNVIYPLIGNSAIQFGATCYSEIIQDGEVVKPKIIGKDNGKIATFNGQKKLDEATGEPIRQGVGEKLKKGQRVATMMNWQLMEQMTWWEDDIDKECHSLPILGTLYKKIYRDSLENMNRSDLIYPDKIIINNGAKNIDSAVVSQIIELYPQEILQRIRSGYFKDFDFDIRKLSDPAPASDSSSVQNQPSLRKTEDIDSNTNIHVFIEQHTWLDLDEDGFLEPWIVTFHYDSGQVVRLIPRFKEKDISYNEKGEIKKIKAQKYFVVRKFLPSFDGGFLGFGFGFLLFNINTAVNTTINQMLDAGHLSITGGGLIGRNVKIRGGKISLTVNEYKMVDVVGGNIADNVYTFPKPEPSPVLFTLLGALIEAGKELASMSDVVSGENAGNIPPSVYMGMADQGAKQYKSIFKRLYKALKEEFRLLYNLNEEYLTNEEYAEILDEDEDELDVKGDFSPKNYDIVPVADPNSIISTQKFAQANFLTGFIGNPNVDQTKLIKQIFNIARITDTDKLVIAPQGQVDPAIQIEQMRLQAKEMDNQIQSQKMMLEAKKDELTTLPKVAAEIEYIKSQAMLNYANVAKVSKDTDLAASKEQLDVMDNIIDAQVRQQEMALRKEELDKKHVLEAAKLNVEMTKISTDAAKHVTKLAHEKEMKEKENSAEKPNDLTTKN